MHNILQEFLRTRKIDKRVRVRLIAILLLLSVCVSAEVFWSLRQTGIAMAGEAHCGLTEHSHSAECGESCARREHTHTVSCYANEAADVESKVDWESTLTGVPFSDDFASDLVAVARIQIGYRESESNFKLNEQGGRNGYTRYGQWYGNPYGDWSGMFVSCRECSFPSACTIPAFPSVFYP